MPPKDKRPTHGMIYVHTSDGPVLLGEVQEDEQYLPHVFATEQEPEEAAEPWPKENPYIILGVDLANGPEITGEMKLEPLEPEEKSQPLVDPELSEKLTQAFKALVDTMGRVIPVVRTFVEEAWKILGQAAALVNSYPNKRVKHLALCAKKERTRKKNMRRIARDMQRRMNRDRP